MKIKLRKYIDSSCQPYVKVRKILDILESSKDFELDIKAFRQKYEFPLRGVKSVTWEGLKVLDLLANREAFEEVARIRDKYRLPITWQHPLYEIICFNECVPPQKGYLIQYGAINDVDAQGVLGDYLDKKFIYIRIAEIISKAELIKYISSEWSNISHFMNESFKKPQMHKMVRIGLARIIAEYRDRHKKTFKEIVMILSKKAKTVEEYDVLNESNVKQIYYRYKRKLIPQS